MIASHPDKKASGPSFKKAFQFNALGAVPQKDGSYRYLRPKPSVSLGPGIAVATEGFRCVTPSIDEQLSSVCRRFGLPDAEKPYAEWTNADIKAWLDQMLEAYRKRCTKNE